MKDFTKYNPTRVEFGKEKETRMGQFMADFNIKKVLIVYGTNRIKSSGLLDRVTTSLNENGIGYLELSGVVSNPLLSKAKEGIDLAKDNQVDAVLAIGGGSVIDTTKTIAAGALYEGDVWDLFTMKAQIQSALPVFTIVTMSASGSETNCGGVVTNDETKEKFFINNPALYPKVSVMNADLLTSVPDNYLAYSAVDIMAHSLDLYLSAEYIPEYNLGHLENIMKTVVRSTECLRKNSNDYEARGEFMWAASCALNNDTFLGVEGNRYDSHMIEHAMSALYNVPHGAGLAVVLPAWMQWYKDLNPERFKRFASAIFDEENGEKGVERLKKWFSDIGAPVSLNELNIEEEAIEQLAVTVNDNMKVYGADAFYTVDFVKMILSNAL